LQLSLHTDELSHATTPRHEKELEKEKKFK